MNKQRGSTMFSMFGIFLALVAVLIALEVSRYNNQETVVVKVTGKERVTSSDSNGQVSSKYLIFSETETFENTDSLIAGKFNSSDFYGKIRENQTCEFVVNGWRVPFLSMYRNIIKMECK